MGDGSLSQEEIDALLMGTDDMAAPAGKGGGAAVSDGGGLSPTDRGEAGTPREWVFLQLARRWYVADRA